MEIHDREVQESPLLQVPREVIFLIRSFLSESDIRNLEWCCFQMYRMKDSLKLCYSESLIPEEEEWNGYLQSFELNLPYIPTNLELKGYNTKALEILGIVLGEKEGKDIRLVSHLTKLSLLKGTVGGTVDLTILREAYSLKELELHLKWRRVLKFWSSSGKNEISVLESMDTNWYKVLPYLKKLEVLKMDEIHGTASLRWIKGLKNLRILELNRWYRLRGLIPLSSLKNLTTLRLDGCHDIRSLRGLEGLEGLKVLSLRDLGWLRCRETLSSLTNLRELDLSGNGITDLRPILKLPLKELWLENMEYLRNYIPLRTIVTLERLHLGSSLVPSLGFIVNLHSLNYLDVSNCHELKDIEAAAGHPSLEDLKVSYTVSKHLHSPIFQREDLRVTVSKSEVETLVDGGVKVGCKLHSHP